MDTETLQKAKELEREIREIETFVNSRGTKAIVPAELDIAGRVTAIDAFNVGRILEVKTITQDLEKLITLVFFTQMKELLATKKKELENL